MKFEKLVSISTNCGYSFYEKLFKEIPDDYSQFGEWGRLNWLDLIDEGLITTYPKEVIIKALSKKGFLVGDKYPNEKLSTLYITTDLNIDKEYIKSIINVYGYFVVREGEDETKKVFAIEPKYPEEINTNDRFFYHLTLKKNLENIKRIGLSPKNSKTMFYHPGNRIYLIKTDYPEIVLQGLKFQLLDSKLKYIKTNYSYEFFEMVKSDYTLENIAVLQVDVEGLKLYNDPMFPTNNDTVTCFTHQNISSDRIKTTNY